MGRQMKDSGVEWMGEIPEEWEVQRLKNILKERNEKNSPVKTENILSLLKDRGVIPYSEKGDIGNKSKTDITGYKLAYPGDIVLNSMNVIIGSVGLSKYFGAVSPVYYMLRPRNPKDDVEFYNYIFQTRDLQKSLIGYGNGIMAHRMRIQMEKLNTVMLPYPSQETQRKVVTFLNQKTTHIDSIIGKTKASIDAFKRYKQALITETVTKGLEPDVPMKDSGIEWIGMIPEHWEVRKMKTLGTSRNGLTYSPDEVVGDGEGTLVLRSSNVQNGRISLEDTVYVAKEISKSLMVEKGDILICSRNGSRKLIGKNAIIEGNMIASFGAFMMIFKSNQNSKYLYYILNSEVFNFYLGTFLSSTINQLTKNNFQNMEVVFCANNKEQEKIVTFLDEKTAHIDSLIQNKEAMIEKLEAYKKSLIYEYVTGKKEVE